MREIYHTTLAVKKNWSWQFLCYLVVDERVQRKFCTNLHSLTLKTSQVLFCICRLCFQIFEKFVDICYKTKASLYFNVKVMICLALFDAYLVYKKDRRSIIRRFDECCESSRLYKQVGKWNCYACYSACFQDGAVEFVKEGEHSEISQVKFRWTIHVLVDNGISILILIMILNSISACLQWSPSIFITIIFDLQFLTSLHVWQGIYAILG